MLRKFFTLAVAAALLSLAVLSIPAAASADVTRSGRTFTASPPTANAVTTIDGYVFVGLPYYNASPAADSAVELWWQLSADPGYLSLPPVASISADTVVSGTVEPGGDAARASWGR
jgi:hypothetical protein